MDRLFAELRHTVRTLRRQPAYTVVAVLTLALGIGATTAIYSVIQGVLLSGMPYVEADRIVAGTAEKPTEL
jgi:putative ABC transport system permease protein